MRRSLLFTLMGTMCYVCCLAQMGSGVKRMSNNQLDSTEIQEYPYHLPLLGKKMAQRGFDVTYPLGIMLNGLAASQKVVISNLKVGFNDQEPQDLDFVKFGDITANIQSVNARVDCWVLPFVNVYGILAKIYTSTEVNLSEPIQASTKTNFDGISYGFGTTLAGGFKGIFITADMNMVWTDVPEFTKPINTIMLTPRVGKVFYMKKKNQSNIAVWVGFSTIFMNRITVGTVKLSELSSDIPRDKLQAIVNEAEAWYQELKPAQKAIVKELAEALLAKLDGLDIKDAAIHYSLDKEPESNFSMNIGLQYQINKRWQLRSEAGFLGGRNSLLLSVNYRLPI